MHMPVIDIRRESTAPRRRLVDHRIPLVILLFALGACRSGQHSTPRPTTTPTSRPTVAPTPALTAAPAEVPSTPTPLPAATSVPVKVHSDAELATLALLQNAEIPERDEHEVARLYAGWDGIFEPPQSGQVLPVGAVTTFKVLVHGQALVDEIEAELAAVGEHAYLWIQDSAGHDFPGPTELANMVGIFDQSFRETEAIFGQVESPGIDGDPRIHLLIAVPETMCGSDPCGVGGYVSAFDLLPPELHEQSNGREMMVLNVNSIAGDGFRSVATHELRHLIAMNYDRSEVGWEIEGSASLASFLVGANGGAEARASLFMSEPDLPLNAWGDDVRPHYGKGFLLSKYLYDRLGPEAYSRYAQSPASGLDALDGLFADGLIDRSGKEMWGDWLVTLALHGHVEVDEQYELGLPGVESVKSTAIELFPITILEEINQFAADFYTISDQGTVTLEFSGSDSVPLLAQPAPSGEFFWLAGNQNFSHVHLTHAIDLSDVATATLEYDAFYDIELGYDFAYLFASVDGGESWTPVEAEGMDGLDPLDDPGSVALAPRFHSGSIAEWQTYTADLTGFAGTSMLLRFTYLTDTFFTGAGLAIDNVRIPEIGFDDTVEPGQGEWQSVGFSRVTARIPQEWHLMLVTWRDGEFDVRQIDVPPDGELNEVVHLSNGGRDSYLIVAASAPSTRELAGYRLTLRR